ncbi:mis18-binding protein 1 isoform X2 [Echeneis naucrates]|uniref:mis18-binding protein 1 isoform X2 n=1 Tax=Echeneis naucrates TaxID=173247 RepID=UPI00111467DD|nr:mis18-binding protein 1 isoform X2 [Echeneis naucrates]
MASYHLLKHTKPESESPAKIFAKLKSKVQREAMCAKERPCNVRDKRGADFNSPRDRPDNFRMTTKLSENQTPEYYHGEARALTLSPISTPQKHPDHSFSDIKNDYTEDVPLLMGAAFMSRNAHTPVKRSFLESTAVSQPLSEVNREQARTDRPQTTSRTPGRDRAPPSHQLSPVRTFSPRRLRKRKWEQQGFGDISSKAQKVNHGGSNEPSAAFSKITHDKTVGEDLGDVRGFPVGRSEMSQFMPDSMYPPPRSVVEKRGVPMMGKIRPMSPAKMFAYMKERESKKEQQEVHEVSSSTRDLFDRGNTFHQSRDAPLSNPHNIADMEDVAFRGVPESAVPVNCSSVESADSQSEDFRTSPAPLEPVLLEDPLVLNSPRISIPKKHQPVFKRNKWPQQAKFPNESVIYLRNWFLRKNHNGLFLDGTHCQDNIPWNSNIIVDRVSNSVVKTVTGRVYILVGKMYSRAESVFPNWFLKKFVNGFPPNWKVFFEKFLSESKEKTEKTKCGRASVSKTTSETSPINLSLRQQRQKVFKTPDSCPPTPSSTKVSRSGRVIKPPLEYWKGGRVILDAQMNVTIHECYDTSSCVPVVNPTVSARKSPKPARVFLPCSEGSEGSETVGDANVSAPLRKVKVSSHRHNRAKVSHDHRLSNPPEPPVEISSRQEQPARTTRSRRKCTAVERLSYVDTVPQMKKRHEKASTQKSKKQTHDTNWLSKNERRQTVRGSPESSTMSDISLQLTDEEFSCKTKKKTKGVYNKSGKVLKSQSSHVTPLRTSSESSDKSGRKQQTRRRVSKKSNETEAAQSQPKSKKSKFINVSPPTQPNSPSLPKSTKSSKRHKAHKGSTVIPEERDEDGWSEAELLKLQEAVSYYPKYMPGYWAKVASIVGTRSAEECHNQHTCQGTAQSPAKKAKNPRKEKGEAPKDPVTDHPVISARVGTLKRKQQVRQFLEAMPRDVDDVFSSAYMQDKRCEIPSICPSEDQDFAMSDLEPLTPMSKIFPEVKTPQCLHITPGMMGSPNRNHDDKYVYQLQKRMKKNQFNVCKQARPSKSFTPSPSVKRTMKRCGKTEDDAFVVWEMFPGNDVALSDSEAEEDFYFSDND